MQRKKSVAVRHSSSTNSTDREKNDARTKELKSFGENVASTETAKKSVEREKRVSGITCTSIKNSEVMDNEKQGLKNSSNSTSVTKSSPTIKPKGYKQLSLLFGLEVQSRKAQEASSIIHTFKKTSSLSMENLSGASSLLPPDILTPDNTKHASQQHNRNQTIVSSNKGKQSVGALGQEISLDCCPTHRIVIKSIGVTGNSKLPSEKAITDHGDQQKAGQTGDPRYESTVKKRKEHMDQNHNDINHESKKTKVEIVEKRDEVAGEADGTWELIQVGIYAVRRCN